MALVWAEEIEEKPKKKLNWNLGLSEKEKRLFAIPEQSGDITGNYLQLEESTFEDLKKRGKIDKTLTFQDTLSNPELYDQVAKTYSEDLMKTFGIPDMETASLWSFRPGWYKKYGGDIEKIPDNVKGSFGKSGKEVMRQRKKALEEGKKRFNISQLLGVETAEAAEPTAQDFETNLETENMQKEITKRQEFLQQQIMEKEKQDPKNWTYEQTKEYFKNNPPQNPQDEATVGYLLDQKKQQKDSIQQGIETQQRIIPEIRAAHLRYKRPITDEERARAVVDIIRKEAGEEVPFGAKVERFITNPEAQAVSKAILLPHWTALEAIRGIIGATEPSTSIKDMLIDSAKKGILEPENTPVASESILKAYPNVDWKLAGVIGTLTEIGIVAPGLLKLFSEPVKGLSKDAQYQQALNATRQTPQWQEAVTKIAQTKNIPVQEVDNQLARKLWEIREEASYFKLINSNIKRASGIDILSEAGTIPIKRKFNIGDIVKFKGKEAKILEIGSKDALLDIAGSTIKASIKAIEGLVKPITPIGEEQKPSVEPPKSPMEVSELLVGEPAKPSKTPLDLSHLPALRKQIETMQEREAKVTMAQDTLDEINNLRQSFFRRIRKYKGEYLKEELTGIPAIYITKEGGITPDEALVELRDKGIELSDEVELKDYLQSLEAERKNLTNIIETEKPGFVTKKETTLLKDKIKAVEMGIRAGNIQTKEQIKDLQSQFVSSLEDIDMPTSDKWRVIKAIKNVQTPRQFQQVLSYVTKRLGGIQEKAERTGLVNDIKQLFVDMPTQNLPVGYKDQIEEIKTKFDPRRQAPVTKRKIESMRSFVERMKATGEEINIPEEKLSLLEKTSLDQLDNTELRLLKDTIQQLHHQGSVFNRLFTDQRNREFDQITQDIVNQIFEGKEITEEASFVKYLRQNNKNLAQASLQKIKDYLYQNLRPELMVNILGKEATETIWNPLSNADTQEIKISDESIRKIWDMFKSINVPKAYVKKFKIGKFNNVTKNNALFIYAHSQNEASLAHLHASGLTEEDIQTFSNSLTPEEKQAVEKLWEYYDKEQWPRINDIYSKINGVHLGKEENYFPIMDLENISELYSKELENELLKRFRLKQASVEKGFTKERVMSEKAFGNFDFFGTVVKNHEQVEHYVAFAQVIRDINKILHNPNITTAIKQKYGDTYYNIMNRWLKDVGYGGNKSINDLLDRVVSRLMNNFMVSVLGYNLLSASKSAVSLLNGADLVGENNLIRSIGKFMKNPIKLTKQVYSKSAMMRHRDFTQEREFHAILSGREAYLGQAKLWQKFKEWSAKPMMISDKVTVIPMWNAAYEAYIRKGDITKNPKLEEEAIAEADRIIRRTQPMGRTLHLPETFRGSALQKTYTLFTNQLNQNFNREYEATRKMLKGENKPVSWVKTQFYLVILSGLLIGLLGRRRMPTAKEMVYDSVSQLSGGLFGLGIFVDAIGRGIITGKSAQMEKALLPKTFAGIAEVGVGLTSKKPSTQAKHLLRGISETAGFPFVATERIISGKPFGEGEKSKIKQNKSKHLRW